MAKTVNVNRIKERFFCILTGSKVYNMKNIIVEIEVSQIDSANDIYNLFKNDPKILKCLRIFQKMSKEKQDVLLMAMEAFMMGRIAELSNQGKGK